MRKSKTAASGGSYLQLRSRRVERTDYSKKKQESHNLASGLSPYSNLEENVQEKKNGDLGGGGGVETSFGENVLEFEGGARVEKQSPEDPNSKLEESLLEVKNGDLDSGGGGGGVEASFGENVLEFEGGARVEKHSPENPNSKLEGSFLEVKNGDLGSDGGGGGGGVEASFGENVLEFEGGARNEAMSRKEGYPGIYRLMLSTGNFEYKTEIDIRTCQSYNEFSLVMHKAWADVTNAEPYEETPTLEEAWPDYHIMYDSYNPTVKGLWQDLKLSLPWEEFKGKVSRVIVCSFHVPED